MTTAPTALLWQRLDTDGTDLAFIDDRAGLRARGVVVAAAPLPHTLRYQLTTGPDWTTTRLEVTVEGAGWSRTVRLSRGDEGWRVTTSEQGDPARATGIGRRRLSLPGIEDPGRLTEARDVDLAAAPLFNTLPVRRLGLLDAAAGTERHLTMAWIRVPFLEVVPDEQVYTVLGDGRIRYRSGSFAADLTLDAHGYVRHYPGLADRPDAPGS